MRTPLLQSYETTYLVLESLQTFFTATCAVCIVFAVLTYFLEPFMAMVRAKRETHTKKFEQQIIERLNKIDAEIQHIKRIVEPLKTDEQ